MSHEAEVEVLEVLQESAAAVGALDTANAIHVAQGKHKGYPSGPQPVVATAAGYALEAEHKHAPGLTEEAQAYKLTEEEMAALAELHEEAELGRPARGVLRPMREKLQALGLLPAGVGLEPPAPSPYEGAA
jgi:hypothetical protein